jgi:hypothetical protein
MDSDDNVSIILFVKREVKELGAFFYYFHFVDKDDAFSTGLSL